MSALSNPFTGVADPAMIPLPFGVDAPAAVVDASEAYVAARAATLEAGEADRRAYKQDLQTDHEHRIADRRARDRGERRPERPQPRRDATAPAYDAALATALAAELAFADAIYEHRPAWLADLEQRQADADRRVTSLLSELAVALRDKHALRVLGVVLRAWRYDPEANESSRLGVLHKSQKRHHRPDFGSVAAEMANNETRMQLVRSAAERSA